MKIINLLTVTIWALSTFPLFAQTTVPSENLEQRGVDSLYYLKDSTEPFTGIMEGRDSLMNAYMRAQLVDGKGEGPYEGFYDEERTILYWRVMVQNNKQEGLYVCYHRNGKTSFEVKMKADKMEGIRRCYYKDGTPFHIHHYRHGKENGKRETFYEGSGKRLNVTHFKKGIEDGKYTVWHENGKCKMRGRYKNGERVGDWKQYDETGKLVIKRNYTKYPLEKEISTQKS